MLTTVLFFAIKALVLFIGILFVGGLIGAALGMLLCKIFHIPIAPRGTAYIAGKGWFLSLEKGMNEELDIAMARNRANEIGYILGLAFTGLFLMVALFTNYPATPAGIVQFITALLSKLALILGQ